MTMQVKDGLGNLVVINTPDEVIAALTPRLDSILAADTYGFSVTAAPAVTAGAYAPGDIVGGMMTFAVASANDVKVVITSVQVLLKSNVTPDLMLVLFNADPSATTQTDNAAYALNAADVFKVIGAISLFPPFAEWQDHGGAKSISVRDLNLLCVPVVGTPNILGLLIDKTGVTLGSTTDLQVRLRGTGVGGR